MFDNDPFNAFDECLDTVEIVLDEMNGVALITFDELEALHSALLRKTHLVASEILGTIRHIIQHRNLFRILFATSFNVRTFSVWSNYLINIKPIKISYLDTNEAEELICRPTVDFQLTYDKDAVERIKELTNSHPALIQIVCSKLVDTINSSNDKPSSITPDYVESHIGPDLFDENMFYFEDIELSQACDIGRKILYLIANNVNNVSTIRSIFSQDIDSAVENLMDRDIISYVYPNQYSFNIELVRQWFVYKRGRFNNKLETR